MDYNGNGILLGIILGGCFKWLGSSEGRSYPDLHAHDSSNRGSNASIRSSWRSSLCGFWRQVLSSMLFLGLQGAPLEISQEKLQISHNHGFVPSVKIRNRFHSFALMDRIFFNNLYLWLPYLSLLRSFSCQ